MHRLPLALIGLATLGACATPGGHASNLAAPAAAPVDIPEANRAARAAIGREDMLSQMTFWAGEYDAFPTDVEAGRNFAETLRKGGRHDRAAQIAAQALQRHPNDSALMMTLGRTLISAGRPQEA